MVGPVRHGKIAVVEDLSHILAGGDRVRCQMARFSIQREVSFVGIDPYEEDEMK